VDVSDEGALRQAAEGLLERCGRVHGVFHCAGVAPGPESVLETGWPGIEAVLAPKLAGTQALERATRGLELEVFCSFSSTSGLLGDFGACSYAMGNRYQIAHAQAAAESGTRHVAVSWPLWREGGMSGEGQQALRYLASSGQRYLESAEAWEALEQILASRHRHVAVFTGEPSRVRAFLERVYSGAGSWGATAPVLRGIAGKGYRAGWAGEPLLQCVKADLCQRIGVLLGLAVQRLDEKAELSEFGFDSLSLAALARDLSGHYELDIVPAVFFGHSTIERVA